jgi:hypothetical protein
MTMTTIPHPPPRPRHPHHPRRSPAPPARFALCALSSRAVREIGRPTFGPTTPMDDVARWRRRARARAPCLRDQSHVIVVDDGDPRRGAPIRARAHRRHPATMSKKPYRHRRRHPSSSSSSSASSSSSSLRAHRDDQIHGDAITRSHTYHSCRCARGGTHRHRHRVRRRHHHPLPTRTLARVSLARAPWARHLSVSRPRARFRFLHIFSSHTAFARVRLRAIRCVRCARCVMCASMGVYGRRDASYT